MTTTPVSERAEAAPTLHWEGDRLIVRVSGTHPPEWVLALIHRIGVAIASRTTRSVLADLVGVTTQISDLERLTFAQAAARWPKVSVAAAFHHTMVDPRRFGELVAQNRGLDLRVFTDVAAARTWLDARAPARPVPEGA